MSAISSAIVKFTSFSAGCTCSPKRLIFIDAAAIQHLR
jgi:hypothetical protein